LIGSRGRRTNPVEKNVTTHEISAPVAAVWDVGQLVKALEHLSDDAVRRLKAFLAEQVKPDGVTV
jgi:hypothetical protein